MKLSSALLLAAQLAAAAQAQVNGTVYLQNAKWSFKAGVVDSAGVAWATFLDMNKTASGFGSLSITTNASYSDSDQMYGAGYIEGVLTQFPIKQQYDNMNAWLASNFNNNTIPPVYQKFFQDQDAWSRQQVASNSSDFWAIVGGVTSQFDGLVAGYASVAPVGEELDVWAFQQLNAAGDFLDLIPALQPGSADAAPWDWQNMEAEDVMKRVLKTTHCSGLIKTDGNFSDIWFGHSAWFIFQGTNRIYKHYELNLNNDAARGQQMSFSSYPGYLSSLDDFYQIWTSNLVVIETSNSIFNMSLYSLVKPQSLFAWQRVRVANMMASNGDEWGYFFSQQNSGTYNNAYTTLTLTGWQPGKPLLPGMLYITEQVPGLVIWGDVTQQLERGYFPMYNVPYWPEIYDISGYPQVFAAFGGESASSPLAGISYQLAPRAQIFRRDQAKVVDMDSFTAIMRYNDYKNDPYSGGSSWNAICSRGDLSSDPSPDGCYDTKASQATWWPLKQALAINGPTTNGGMLPPFSWSQFPSTPHEGLPYTYNFEFGVQVPNW